MVSVTPPQPLMATASTSPEDMMGTLIKNNSTRNSKNYHKQIKTLRIHVQIVPTVVPFILIFPDQIDKAQINQNQVQNYRNSNNNNYTITVRTINTKTVAISKTTGIITSATHQTSDKTEVTQTNNHADIVTKQITSPRIVEHVLFVEN